MKITPAQHDLYIQTRIASHISTLVDKQTATHETTLPAEKVKKRSEHQAERELRDATKEAWE